MDKQEREILRRNHTLLIKNIILTDEVYQLLRVYHVLPETMLKDVQSAKTREDRNNKLLELLQLRGCDSFRKFRHVLVLSGHSFLGDVLYEDANENITLLKGDDIFPEFPSIFTHISDDVKSRLLRFLDSKVRESLLAASWKQKPSEREEAQTMYIQGYEHERDLRNKLENKQRQARQLFDDTSRFKDILRKRDIEIEVLKRELEENKQKFKSELSVQAKFNAANNNSILKLKDRFTSFNGKIKQLNSMLRSFLGEEEEMFENDPDNTKLTFLERNLKRSLQLARETMTTANNNEDDRLAVLMILKKSPKKQASIPDIVRKYVEKEEKGKLLMYREVEKLRDTINTRCYSKAKNRPQQAITDIKLLRTMVATIRVEIEHLQKKLTWKDGQISDLLEENAALRDSIGCTTMPTLFPSTSVKASSYFDSNFSETEEKINGLSEDNQVSNVPHLELKGTQTESVAGEYTSFEPFTENSKRIKNGENNIKENKCENCKHCEKSVSECKGWGSSDIKHNEYGGRQCEENLKAAKEVTQKAHGDGSLDSKSDLEVTKNWESPTSSSAFVNQCLLPDIHEQRGHASSRQSRKRLSIDFATIVENTNDNTELEMVVHLLSKKAEKEMKSRLTSHV